MTWPGHAERMVDEKMAKRADAQNMEGKEDDGGLLKRYIEREEEEWRKSTTDRKSWRLLIENVEREK